MEKLLTTGRLVLATLVAILPVVTIAAKPKWQVLFNGTSTDAWRGFRRENFPSKCWTIENGELRTVAGCDRTDQVDIITKEKYQNFEMALEWRVAQGANSGIMYYVSEDANATWMTGPEMQVLDDDKHVDGKVPNTSAGALYGLIAPTKKTLRPVGEFNKVKITVRNDHVEYRLNGKKIVEFDLRGESLNTLIAQSKFKNFPRFARNRQGHVALQYHGDDVWYRNIRIRSLTGK
jgi:hypothetical protein